MLLKVCGATSTGDVDLLRAAGANLVGLWHGMTGGSAELTARALSSLATACRTAGTLEPVLVTFLKEPSALLDVAQRGLIDWLQLHGYQPPAVVGALKRARPELTVVKVLHVQGVDCVEVPLLSAYERAGTDYFLLDAMTDGGRVGSTGRSLDPSVVVDLADRMTKPFLLAGGISAEIRPKYGEVVAHPRFAGVDVDTAARDRAGRMHLERVSSLRRHWSSVQDQDQEGVS
jgi:phosphoribosylanthranilate isomerase